MSRNLKPEIRNPKLNRLIPLLLKWFAANARDLPWRRTRDPYAIWVSEIMLQQTQVKTVIPFWNRWLRELPTIQAVDKASPAKIHKLWEGLGYYTRARNLQKAAQQIVNRRRDELHESPSKGKKVRDSQSSSFRNLPVRFPEKFEDVLALPGIGRYTAGAICSIAFNQPTPILDGNVIRVLTRVFGIGKNPKEKKTNARLWKLADDLVGRALRYPPRRGEDTAPYHCSHFNQSLMELGALVCTPRNPQCKICPVKKFCVAFQEDRVNKLPNLGKREKATARKFVAFVIERDGKLFVRQRPPGVVNAHLWEFPNTEVNGNKISAKEIFKSEFGFTPQALSPLTTLKHSITRYRITQEAFMASAESLPPKTTGVWKTPAKVQQLAFTAAHKKLATFAVNRILSRR